MPHLLQRDNDWGLRHELAGTRLQTREIGIQLESVQRRQLTPYLDLILAHELGHLYLWPLNLEHYYTLLQTVRYCLAQEAPDRQPLAPQIVNALCDFVVNQRLYRATAQRQRMPQFMSALYAEAQDAWSQWTLRVYEHLWQMEAQSLNTSEKTKTNLAPASDIQRDAEAEEDAELLAQVLVHNARRRSPASLEYSQDPESPLYLMVSLCWPHCLALEQADTALLLPRPESAAHYAPGLSWQSLNARHAATGNPSQNAQAPHALQDYLAVFPEASHEQLVQYYREQAWPYAFQFAPPARQAQGGSLPQGYRSWKVDDPVQALHWAASLSQSPRPIPGYTTVQARQEKIRGEENAQAPQALTLYLDCSLSTPDPLKERSLLLVACFILALSAEQAGLSYSILPWSETQLNTPVEDRRHWASLLAFPRRQTAFPVDDLKRRQQQEPTRHYLILSDSGFLSALQPTQWPELQRCSSLAQGPCTLLLMLPDDRLRQHPTLQALASSGWHIQLLKQGTLHQLRELLQ